MTRYFIKGWSFLIFLFCFNYVSAQQEYIIEFLNTGINTRSYDEIAPIISQDEQTMYFTRQGFPIFNRTLVENGVDLAGTLSKKDYERKLQEVYSSLAGKPIQPNPSGNAFNQDIWVAQSRQGLLDQVSHPKAPINNAFPNSICALFNNEQSAIVINQFPKAGGIQPGFSIMHKDGNDCWTTPQPVLIDGVKEIAPDVSLAVAEKGDAIILSLDHIDAYGGNDLFVSFKTGENTFGKPVHMGPAINSQAHEKSAFLSFDGKTMFFASNRSNVMGGYDIFMSYRLDDSWQNWTSPKRFVGPINSTANEGFPSFNRSSGYLYFASDRNGSSDIFRVKIAPPIADQVTVVGNILDESKKKQQRATVLLRSKESGIYQDTYVSTDGFYEIKVPMGQTYQVLARKPGYQSNRETINFEKSDVYFKKHHIDFALKPLQEGQAIDLNTIYFKKSMATILPKSHSELEYLADILQHNEDLVISIEGHTDNQGGKAALVQLSEERAQVIKQYLVRKGKIDSYRIQTVGFGGAEPLNDNSNEQLRRENRRVEVKIIRGANKTANEITTSLERSK